MFKSFRAKLTSVKNDVTASIKSVSDGLSNKHSSSSQENVTSLAEYNQTSLDHEAEPPLDKEHNDAAQDLLHRYEGIWEEMYSNTEGNLKKARVVVKDFHSIQSTASLHDIKCSEFELEVKELPSMLSAIQKITDQIVDLHSQCALIENSLAVLANLCEESDLEKAKQGELQRFYAYEFHKKKQLSDYSANLANEHRKKIISTELREAGLRREKELFYQKAFEEDIQRFRTEQSRKQTNTSLDKVTLAADREELQHLEDFLNDDQNTVGSDTIDQTEQSTTSSSNTDNTKMRNGELSKEKEGSDTDQSTRHSDISSDDLEWDENGDNINMLDDSLENEINSIVGGSSLSLDDNTESEGTILDDTSTDGNVTAEETNANTIEGTVAEQAKSSGPTGEHAVE